MSNSVIFLIYLM